MGFAYIYTNIDFDSLKFNNPNFVIYVPGVVFCSNVLYQLLSGFVVNQ